MLSRKNPAQPPTSWTTSHVHWEGCLVVQRSFQDGKFSRIPLLNEEKAEEVFNRLFGPELGARALRLFQWALELYKTNPLGKIEGSQPCPDPEVKSLLKDLHGNYSLPTLTVDAEYVVNGWVPGEGGREEVAFLLSLVGCAKNLFNWDNSPIELKISTWHKKRVELALLPWPAKIVEDSGWSTKTRGKSYHESIRALKFERVLTREEADQAQLKMTYCEGSQSGRPLITSGDLQTFQLMHVVDSSD